MRVMRLASMLKSTCMLFYDFTPCKTNALCSGLSDTCQPVTATSRTLLNVKRAVRWMYTCASCCAAFVGCNCFKLSHSSLLHFEFALTFHVDAFGLCMTFKVRGWSHPRLLLDEGEMVRLAVTVFVKFLRKRGPCTAASRSSQVKVAVGKQLLVCRGGSGRSLVGRASYLGAVRPHRAIASSRVKESLYI
jgi:hypothetical protein